MCVCVCACDSLRPGLKYIVKKEVTVVVVVVVGFVFLLRPGYCMEVCLAPIYDLCVKG